MKWQKNTGVMPCEKGAYVELRFGDGSSYIGKAGYQDWTLERIDKITHWCIAERVPFDYVEPKVWTVEYDQILTTYRLYNNGRLVFSCNYGESTLMSMKRLEDALNAMEERNGTK